MEQDKALHTEMDKILNRDIVSVTEWQKSAFDEFVQPFQESIVLFGAGNLGRRMLACLRQNGIEPKAFSDNNPNLVGKSIDGLQVISPEEAAGKYGSTCAFVVTIWNTEHSFIQTRKQLSALNCKKIVSAVLLRWKYAESFLPFFWLDLPSKTIEKADLIRSAFSLWADEFSRTEYLAQLRFRILGDFDPLSAPVAQESYFPDDIFSLREDEVFVDCGAFNGITLQQFLKRQKSFKGKIAAFEPDPANFEDLRKYVADLPAGVKENTHIRPFAVGSRKGKVHFDATGTMGSTISENGSLEIELVTLDECLAEANLTPSYIKMDIEGSEMEALAGARKIIQDNAPILAICLYHRYDDLWNIPLFISSLSSQYRLFLRPHEIEGWQLVCYAVPLSRLKNQ